VRAYLALLFGNGDDDPLFLQAKEASPPALAPYVPEVPGVFAHEGKRVVSGQRVLQASSDILLGWTSIDKATVLRAPDEEYQGVNPHRMADRPALLRIRLHVRRHPGPRPRSFGRRGLHRRIQWQTDVLDHALADFGEAYGDQTERDHATLVKAVTKRPSMCHRRGWRKAGITGADPQKRNSQLLFQFHFGKVFTKVTLFGKSRDLAFCSQPKRLGTCEIRKCVSVVSLVSTVSFRYANNGYFGTLSERRRA
jgi:hypothetical protein